MSLKSRAIIATIRAANQLRAKKELKSLKSHILRVKGKKTEAKHTFKQKPKIGGGQEPITTAGTRYGTGATEHKVYEPGAALARKRWGTAWPHEREGWRAQMDRMYGGVHMSQNPKLVKKSIKMLTKKLKKKKVVKALRGALIKKGTKLAYRLATQKYPTLFKKKKFSIAELKNRFQPFWTHKIGTMGQRSEWPSQRLDQGCLQLDDAPKNANSLQVQFERNKILQNWQRDRVIFPWIIVLGLLIFIGFSRWLPASGRGSESAEHIEPAHEFCENCGCLNCCSQGASGNLELLEVHRGLVNLESTVRELTSQLEDNRPAIAEKSQAPEVEVFGGSKIVRPIK